MGVTASQLIMGPGALYSGAFGATEPADTAIATAPSSATFTDVGGTLGGVKLKIEQKFKELEVDQIVDNVGRRLTMREMTISTEMAEPTLENLVLAANGSGSITSGSGFKSFVPANDSSATQPSYRCFIFDGFAASGGVRRVIARRCLSTSNVEFEYSKDKQTTFKVEFSCHYVSPSIAPYKVIDQA
jgi:hypothetical protein